MTFNSKPDINEKYISLALKQAHLSLKYADVPIGAVVVSGDKVIAKGYNQVEKTNNPLAHAEIIAIEKAVKKIGYKHLSDCEIYVTLEPCTMCSGAIVLARFKKLVFGAYDPKTGASGSLYSITNDRRLNHRCEVIGGVLQEECSQLLKDFFKKLRKK